MSSPSVKNPVSQAMHKMDDITTLDVSKWCSSPPFSLSLKGKTIGCGRIYYGKVHDEPLQLRPVWYRGYLHRFTHAYKVSGLILLAPLFFCI